MTKYQEICREIANYKEQFQEALNSKNSKEIEQCYKLIPKVETLKKLRDKYEKEEQEEQEEINNIGGDKMNNELTNFYNEFRNGNFSNVMKATEHGELIPEKIADDIIRKLDNNDDISAECDLLKPFKGSLKFISEAEGVNVSYTDEDMETPESVLTFNTKVLEPTLLMGKSVVSKSLLLNSQLNLHEYIVDMYYKAVKNIINSELVNGTGVKDEGAVGHRFEGIVNTKTVVPMSGESVCVDDIIDLQLAIPSAKISKSVFVMSSRSLAKIAKLKDGNNDPYVIRDVAKDGSKILKLLGNKIVIEESCGDNVFFGSLKDAVKYSVRNLAIQVLKEVLAIKFQEVYLMTLEASSVLVDDTMVAKMVIA